MITVGMNYDVIPGKEELFEEKFRQVIGALEAAEGHTVSRLYLDVDSAGSYLIISEWSDQEAFTAFIRSEAFRAVTDWGREEILRDRPRHRVYQH